MITCCDFAFLFLMAHAIPAAAIKQSAPPTEAPITILGLALVLVESLIELKLRFNKLEWLDTVLVRAVPPSKGRNPQGCQCQEIGCQCQEISRKFNLLIYCLVLLNLNLVLYIALSQSNLY